VPRTAGSGGAGGPARTITAPPHLDPPPDQAARRCTVTQLHQCTPTSCPAAGREARCRDVAMWQRV